MHNDPTDAAVLALSHPDYSLSTSLFRMNGTSMATAATSGVVALMLEAHPELTPNQVKYRLQQSARPALTEEGEPVYNIFQQGAGRIWAPDAVLGDFDLGEANPGMDIQADLSHGLGWVDHNGDGIVEAGEVDETELSYHYLGPIRATDLVNENGNRVGRLFYVIDPDGQEYVMGAVDIRTGEWKGEADLNS